MHTGNSRRVSRFSPTAVLTSPSLYLLAAWATGAPPGRPLLLDCALPCHGKGCAGPGGSWWTPASTGMCVRRDVPPVGHGSTFLLLPVMGKERKYHVHVVSFF